MNQEVNEKSFLNRSQKRGNKVRIVVINFENSLNTFLL